MGSNQAVDGRRSRAGTTTERIEGRELAELHRAYASEREPEVQARLLQRYQGLARSLAARAAKPSDELDDLIQVAMLGVLNALERYDPDRGVEFTTFAWATVQGELKRHHRDRGWAIHVPRRLQEAYLRVAAAVEELSQDLGRQPTITEIADYTGDEEDLVIRAIDVRSARRPASIDIRVGDSQDLAWEPGAEDRRFAAVDEHSLLAALLPRLPAREREVLELRFVQNLTQAQIASEVGYSQMHVSRILSRALERLREWVEIENRAVPRCQSGATGSRAGQLAVPLS
ncbi:MAG: sigma-70 family RNA polymerase sigma factor [Actinobacteria bacterium]|nr:sigma-70 family RNA polymerase sigma factor [Actinomycetota bacterium]